MPLLNYTTKVDPGKTAVEIQTILAKAGASTVRVDYEGGEPVAIFFLIKINDVPVPFRVPSNWRGVYGILSKDVSIRRIYRTEEHAKRVAWRVVKDWVEAQMAFIEAGQATMSQLFLPHAIRRDGRTFYEEVATSPVSLLLPEGEEVAAEVVDGEVE